MTANTDVIAGPKGEAKEDFNASPSKAASAVGSPTATSSASVVHGPSTEGFFVQQYFPAPGPHLPFHKYFNSLFFDPIKDNTDFPIHGPNVIRLVRAMVNNRLEGEPGLLAGDEKDRDRARNTYFRYHTLIRESLEIDDDPQSSQKVEHFLSIAALCHDIGKVIRRANHPQIGFNLLRNFDDDERNKLVNSLTQPGETNEHSSKHNRFSLICSITQHHDKFGVVSTGEGSLPLFSDILYFTSDHSMIRGIKKNVTSVMLLNLADIAAVCTALPEDQQRALKIVQEVNKVRSAGDYQAEQPLLCELIDIIKRPSSCLGLSPRKIATVLSDWKILIDSIESPSVQGNRGRLKKRLLEIEQNPARTIERVLRLLIEAATTSGATNLKEFMDPTRVESVLVGALGSHEFQVFCERFAKVAKLDYGLNFFKAIVCACVRVAVAESLAREEKRDWRNLSGIEIQKLEFMERGDLQHIASHITALFVKVLNGLVTRYSEVLDGSPTDPRRFGFQMKDLTSDARIRESIIGLLCAETNMDHVALTWIADEVTIWSLD